VERKKCHINDFDIIKHHLGELTDDEDNRVVAWSKVNTHNLNLYNNYKRIIGALNDLKNIKHFSIQNAWQNLDQIDNA
jgi:hypothetical protein